MREFKDLKIAVAGTGLRGLTFSPQPVSACHGALRPA